MSRRGPWTVLSSREVYANLWYRVREDEVLRPDGTPGIYAVVECKPAVAIVALTETREVYLVGQYRYATDRFSWEIPAGMVEPGETHEETAARELTEEAGVRAGRFTSLGEVQLANAETDLVGRIFLAEDVEVATAKPDEAERITIEVVPLDEAVRRAAQGEITQAFSVVGLLRAWHHLNQ